MALPWEALESQQEQIGEVLLDQLTEQGVVFPTQINGELTYVTFSRIGDLAISMGPIDGSFDTISMVFDSTEEITVGKIESLIQTVASTRGDILQVRVDEQTSIKDVYAEA